MTASLQTPPFRDRRVGDIAATLPGATAVFRKFGLDFCCAGDAPLSVAASQHGADLAAIERDLGALDPAEGPLDGLAETPDLIRHILARFHETHRRELPELIALARRVEAVHAEHPLVPRGLGEQLQQMAGELEVHMKKEELILFPAMTRMPDGLGTPISRMREEHVGHGIQLDRLAEIARNFELPDDACRSWRALYAGAAKFTNDVMEHIHLENNVLFPRFEQR